MSHALNKNTMQTESRAVQTRLNGQLFKYHSSIKLWTLALSVPLFFALDPDILNYAAYAAWIAFLLLSMSVRRLDNFGGQVCRCVLALIIGRLCVEVYSQFYTTHLADEWKALLNIKDSYSQQFYQAISTSYAILTALALVKGMEDFDALNHHFSDEASKIGSIWTLLGYFEDEHSANDNLGVTQAIKRALLKYIGNVMNKSDIQGTPENEELIRQCTLSVSRLKCNDDNDQVALTEIIKGFIDLSTLRAKRLAASQDNMPVFLIIALWLMSFALIIPFFAEDPTATENSFKWSQYYMVFTMGTFYSFLLVMLADISSPFDGFWQVNVKVFDKLHEKLSSNFAGWR